MPAVTCSKSCANPSFQIRTILLGHVVIHGMDSSALKQYPEDGKEQLMIVVAMVTLLESHTGTSNDECCRQSLKFR